MSRKQLQTFGPLIGLLASLNWCGVPPPSYIKIRSHLVQEQVGKIFYHVLSDILMAALLVRAVVGLK